VAVVLEGSRAQTVQLTEHQLTGLARLHAAAPRVCARLEGAERRRNGSCRLLTELVAPDAAKILDRAEPSLLGHVAAESVVRGHLRLRGNPQHRVPIDRRVVACS